MTSARRALTVSVGACLLAALTGNAALGDALTEWYASLKQPPFGLPFEAWLVVGVLYYLLMGAVLYRVLRYVGPSQNRGRVVALVLAVLVGNEAWNALFFGLQSTLWGLVGMLGFTSLLGTLWVTLRERERTSSRWLSVYLAWVALYDVSWAFALWLLNPAA